jgi:hypothetical protein
LSTRVASVGRGKKGLHKRRVGVVRRLEEIKVLAASRFLVGMPRAASGLAVAVRSSEAAGSIG